MSRLSREEIKEIAKPALLKLGKNVKDRKSFAKVWLPRLFEVPRLSNRPRKGEWSTSRKLKPFSKKLTKFAAEVQAACRSTRLFLSSPYPAGYFADLAPKMCEFAECIQRALSQRDLTPSVSPRAVHLTWLVEWIRKEKGHPHYPEISSLLDLVFILADTKPGKGLSSDADLQKLVDRTNKKLVDRTNKKSLRKNQAELCAWFVENLDLPDDLTRRFAKIAEKEDILPAS
jgi:hypothetical protein